MGYGKGLIKVKETQHIETPRPLLPPTTKDLAKIAGVSRATVDRVLNGRDGVKQKTVDRVNAAVKELGFIRNLQAANLARSKNYRFLFVLPNSGEQFLQEIVRHVKEAETIFSPDRVSIDIHNIDENDPHRISDYLTTLRPDAVTGVAIMAPETPQVRDAITRLQERGVAALPFISNQTMMDEHWVGIDNRAAGATAATLLGRFIKMTSGSIMVVAESLQLRDSLERRLGFDNAINTDFTHLRALPTLETYGSDDRARTILTATLRANPSIAGIYIMSSEARGPLTILRGLALPPDVVKIAHERTPFAVDALLRGDLDAVITQDTGHLVRSAVRRLKGIVDQRETLTSQEKIRVEILLKTNL